MKTVDGASLCSFWDDLDKTTDSFKGFNLEKRVEGEEMFELDRAELLSSTLVYLNARFKPLLKNPVLMWIEGSVEHRRWPAADHPTPGALMDWGNEDLRSLAKHFSGLEAMQHFDVNEAIFEYKRAKIELLGEPFFILSYRQFWEHVSAHYDNVHGYPVLLILVRPTLLILPDSSPCERGFSEYNRIHTSERPNLKLDTVRSLFAVRHYGPELAADFNAEQMCENWMGTITEDEGGAASTPKRRSLAALYKKTMQMANSDAAY